MRKHGVKLGGWNRLLARKIGERGATGTASLVCALLPQHIPCADFLVHIGEIDGRQPHCREKREIPVLLK